MLWCSRGDDDESGMEMEMMRMVRSVGDGSGGVVGVVAAGGGEGGDEVVAVVGGWLESGRSGAEKRKERELGAR
ncbi:hypothetical protein Tco_1016972 [Tanacetum coccineum]|uniref:Uncharacterized protein n=1 Tax=Tanacetum coccineum TaxID=301880 RepID=A0ABQ5FQ61_9ASTR